MAGGGVGTNAQDVVYQWSGSEKLISAPLALTFRRRSSSLLALLNCGGMCFEWPCKDLAKGRFKGIHQPALALSLFLYVSLTHHHIKDFTGFTRILTSCPSCISLLWTAFINQCFPCHAQPPPLCVSLIHFTSTNVLMESWGQGRFLAYCHLLKIATASLGTPPNVGTLCQSHRLHEITPTCFFNVRLVPSRCPGKYGNKWDYQSQNDHIDNHLLCITSLPGLYNI